MSDFRKSLMITAIPIATLSVVSVLVGSAISPPGTGVLGFVILWSIPAFLLLIATLVTIVYSVKGRRTRAAGIWAGIGIGIVSLGLSCFAHRITL